MNYLQNSQVTEELKNKVESFYKATLFPVLFYSFNGNPILISESEIHSGSKNINYQKEIFDTIFEGDNLTDFCITLDISDVVIDVKYLVFGRFELKDKRIRCLDNDSTFSVDQVKGIINFYINLLKEYKEQLISHSILESGSEQSVSKIIFENNPYSIAIRDKETGKYVDANPAFEKLTGYKKEEVLGKTIPEVGIIVFNEKLRQDQERFFKSGILLNCKRILKTKQGNFINILYSAITGVINGRKYNITFSIDTSILEDISEENKKADERLLSLIDFLPDATFAIDLEGYVIAWNKEMEKMTGVKKEDVIYTKNYAESFYRKKRNMLIDYVFSPDLIQQEQHLYVITEEATVIGEAYDQNFYSGRGAHLWGKASPLLDANGKVIGAIESIRDITEKKKNEKEILKSKEQFQRIVNDMPLGIVLLGAFKDDDADVLIYNNAFTEITGYDINNTPSLKYWLYKAYPDEEYRKNAIGDIERVISNAKINKKKPETLVKNVKCDNGSVKIIEFYYVDFEDSGMWILNDITEKIMQEKLIKEEQDRFKIIAMQTGQMIFDYYVDDDVIYWDGAIEEITGLKAESIAVTGLAFWENLVHPEDLKNALVTLNNAIEGKQDYNMVYRFKHSSGEYNVIEESGVFVENAENKKMRSLGSMKNITQRTQQEIELKKKNEELAQFTYTVSHDLKSPLVTIKAFIGFLLTDIEKNRKDRVETDLMHINKATDKMTTLLDELLQLSRVGRITNEPTEFKIKDVVNEVLELLHGAIHGKKITIVNNLENLIVTADKTRITEIFQNLIDNAAKFISAEQSEKIIEISSDKNIKGEYEIIITDNGIGIEKKFQHKLFGLFEKLNPDIEGTGIGLALVKKIVEIHGGQIRVESEGLGLGSKFIFTLNNLRLDN